MKILRVIALVIIIAYIYVSLFVALDMTVPVPLFSPKPELDWAAAVIVAVIWVVAECINKRKRKFPY